MYSLTKQSNFHALVDPVAGQRNVLFSLQDDGPIEIGHFYPYVEHDDELGKDVTYAILNTHIGKKMRYCFI